MLYMESDFSITRHNIGQVANYCSTKFEVLKLASSLALVNDRDACQASKRKNKALAIQPVLQSNRKTVAYAENFYGGVHFYLVHVVCDVTI